MKKIILILIVFCSASVFKAVAVEPTHMDINLQEEFKALDEIENYINETNCDLERLNQNQKSLLADVSLAESNAIISKDFESTLGIPPFLWGCVFGVIGILLVFLISDKDRDATKRAMFGCLVVYGTVAVVYIVLLAIGIGTFSLAL